MSHFRLGTLLPVVVQDIELSIRVSVMRNPLPDLHSLLVIQQRDEVLQGVTCQRTRSTVSHGVTSKYEKHSDNTPRTSPERNLRAEETTSDQLGRSLNQVLLTAADIFSQSRTFSSSCQRKVWKFSISLRSKVNWDIHRMNELTFHVLILSSGSSQMKVLSMLKKLW